MARERTVLASDGATANETQRTAHSIGRRSYLLMTGSAITLAGVAGSATASGADGDGENEGAGAYHVNGSYPAWGWWSDYRPSDIPFELLDFVDISDFTPTEDGTVEFSYPEIERDVLEGFRDVDRDGTKVIAKIGGWTGSTEFSDAALTDERRRRFAETTLEYLRTYDLDGAEINWEFPLGGGADGNVERDEDPENWLALFKTVRERFDDAGEADGRYYWLTASMPNHPWRAREHDMEHIATLVDYAKLQGYHITGGWSSETGHHSALYSDTDDGDHRYTPSVHYAVQTWIDEGFPPEKINLGTPAFATLFSGVTDGDSNGLGQSFSSQEEYPGYEAIVNEYLPDTEYEVFWDETAQVPWIYSSTHEEFIAYDDVESVERKCEYVAERGLHGVQFWELMRDTSDYALVRRAYETRNEVEDSPDEEEEDEDREDEDDDDSGRRLGVRRERNDAVRRWLES